MSADLKVVQLPIDDCNEFGKLYGVIMGLLSTSELSQAECLGVLECVKFKVMCDMKGLEI